MAGRILTVISFMVLALTAQAQDIHFSQYFSAPLILNPALTGSFNADFRVAANFRDQSFKQDYGVSPGTYLTFAGSFDASLFKKKLKYDQFGVGVAFFNDRAGSGALTTTSVLASVAYHKVVDRFARHSITLGLQAGFFQKRIDFTKLTFEDQFNGDDGFDPLAANNENIDQSSFIAPDLGFGVLWRSRFGKKVNVYVGGSYTHITQPKQSFLGDDDSRLSAKVTVHGGSDIKLGKFLTLTPGFMILYQGTATEYTFGTALGYKINDVNNLYIGAWYRINDAIVPMIAYELFDVRLGVSFDATASTQKVANQGRGAIELSLIYVHGQKGQREISPIQFCPKF